MKYYALLARGPWAGPTAHYMDSRFDLHRGVLVTPPTNPLRYELRVDANKEGPSAFPPLDLHDARRGHILVSERMKQCLDDAGVDNVQYLRGEAIYIPTGEKLSYHVANIIGLVRALDIDASQCSIDENGIVEKFDRLHIDESASHSLDVFRLFETFLLVIVSERIRRTLERACISGIRFMSEENWEPGTL